jgi:hypothetical protein
VISAAWEPEGVVVRVTGRDRFLVWPEPQEIVIPSGAVSGATSYPALSALPDRDRLFGSTGVGLRTLPLLPGRWVFGRRRINNERFFFAVRGRATPVLVVTARHWHMDGVVVSTPDAARIADAISRLGDTAMSGTRRLATHEA